MRSTTASRWALITIGGICWCISLPLILQTRFGTREQVDALSLHLVGLFAWIFMQAGNTIRLSALEPPPQHDGMVREAHFRLRIQVLRAAYGLVLLSAVLIGATLTIKNARDWIELRRHGVLTDALITGPVVSDDGRAIDVTYAIPVPGRLPVVDHFRAPRENGMLQKMRVMGVLRATYLRSNPEVHTLEVVDNTIVAQKVGALTLLFLIGAVYVGAPILLAESLLRSQLRLARIGRPMTGTITGCRPLYWRGQVRAYHVTYSYTPTGGRIHAGRALIAPGGGEPTLVGFPIVILVDPARPWHYCPLDAFRIIAFARSPRSSYASI